MKRTILFIMTDLCGGGAEKALIELLKVFDYNQYEVSLCLIFNRGVYLEDIPKSVSVISLFNNEDSFYHRKAYGYYKKHNNFYFLSLYLRFRLKKCYDVIISFLEGRPMLYHSFIMNRGKKNFSWIHCDLFNYHFSHYCYYKMSQEIECYRRVDGLIFVSKFAKENFERLYSIKTAKYCLYNIVDVNQIAALSNEKIGDKTKFTITAIGSLIEVKGFDRLIRVAKMLKDEGYDFVVQIIGIGEKKKELIDLRDKLILQDVVSFLGFKKPPYSYLRQSDLFVSTSISEGLSLVICEALALSVPIVSTRTAGALELLDDGKYGILAEQNDASVYEGIKKMMDDENLRSEFQRRAKMRAKVFDVHQTMRMFYEIING